MESTPKSSTLKTQRNAGAEGCIGLVIPLICIREGPILAVNGLLPFNLGLSKVFRLIQEVKPAKFLSLVYGHQPLIGISPVLHMTRTGACGEAVATIPAHF